MERWKENEWLLGRVGLKPVFIFNEVVFFSQVKETGAHLNVFGEEPVKRKRLKGQGLNQ